MLWRMSHTSCPGTAEIRQRAQKTEHCKNNCSFTNQTPYSPIFPSVTYVFNSNTKPFTDLPSGDSREAFPNCTQPHHVWTARQEIGPLEGAGAHPTHSGPRLAAWQSSSPFLSPLTGEQKSGTPSGWADSTRPRGWAQAELGAPPRQSRGAASPHSLSRERSPEEAAGRPPLLPRSPGMGSAGSIYSPGSAP